MGARLAQQTHQLFCFHKELARNNTDGEECDGLKTSIRSQCPHANFHHAKHSPSRWRYWKSGDGEEEGRRGDNIFRQKCIFKPSDE